MLTLAPSLPSLPPCLPSRPRYAAPASGSSIVYACTAGQLAFVALLLLFFLVEFGLLAAHAGFEAGLTPWGFYAPKAAAMVLYFAMAVAAYGWLIMQQQRDPTFDWSSYAYDAAYASAFGGGGAAAPGGADGASSALFFTVWVALLGGLYCVQLGWLLLRSAAALCALPAPQRAVFALHFLVLCAALLGLAAGAVLDVDVQSALQLLFFNALLNAYVCLLAFLYTPLAYTELEEAAAAVGAAAEGDGGGGRGIGDGAAGAALEERAVSSREGPGEEAAAAREEPAEAVEDGGPFGGGGAGGGVGAGDDADADVTALDEGAVRRPEGVVVGVGGRAGRKRTLGPGTPYRGEDDDDDDGASGSGDRDPTDPGGAAGDAVFGLGDLRPVMLSSSVVATGPAPC